MASTCTGDMPSPPLGSEWSRNLNSNFCHGGVWTPDLAV